MVARPRSLVTVFRLGVVVVVVPVLLTFTPVLPTRVARAAAVFPSVGLVVPPRGYRISRACQLRYASPSSPSCPKAWFKQSVAFRKGCLRCLNGCVSSSKPRQ